MDLASLIDALSQPRAYPFAVTQVEVRQTHISAVFLAGDLVYKIKKPVNFGFLDFSTPEKRRYFCQEEVRLNARLAREVYLDVVPVVDDGGQIRVEGQGEVVEWAVKMRRLPDEAMLEHRLADGSADQASLAKVARRIAAFHATAAAGEPISQFGRFDVVARNARENLAAVAPRVGTVISQAVFGRLRAILEESLARNRDLIEARAARGVPRDTHGDLRLGHVYLFPERSPPDDIVIVDCIEFNERFRFADPVADIAFLLASLKSHGRGDLARGFAEEYFRAAGDDQGAVLLPLYTSYRAAVRGKVETLHWAEPEVPPRERDLALAKARGYWLLALSELEQPSARPALVLIGGLPGTGKSTLAARLAERAGFQVIRSDVVRKELAGVIGQASPREFGQGIYASAWTERTYCECLRRAEALLFEGRRVIVDASFGQTAHREAFLQTATRWCVPAVLLICQADEQVVRKRIAERQGDASDADWRIYEQAAKRWQAMDESTRRVARAIDTGGEAARSLEQALAALADRAS